MSEPEYKQQQQQQQLQGGGDDDDGVPLWSTGSRPSQTKLSIKIWRTLTAWLRRLVKSCAKVAEHRTQDAEGERLGLLEDCDLNGDPPPSDQGYTPITGGGEDKETLQGLMRDFVEGDDNALQHAFDLGSSDKDDKQA